MPSPDEKWEWIDFLGRDLASAANERRVLIGWAGSATVAVAIVSWSLLTLLESTPSSSIGITAFGLALSGFLVARAVAAVYPGGFGGLVDEIIGTGPGGDLELSPLVDFIFANLALVRSRVVLLSLVDLFPILLLIFIAATPSSLPGGAPALVQLLILVRLLIFLFYLAFMLVFLSKPLLVRSSAERTDRAINLLEQNPQVARIVLKFVILERLGSVSTNLLYYGVQLVIAAWIVTAFAGSVFLMAQLLLLASVASVLVVIVWELWKRAKELAIRMSFIGDLQHEILTGKLKEDDLPKEYAETFKDIRTELAAPYVIPDSVWKARGETPPSQT
jgi:hypothetical protein